MKAAIFYFSRYGNGKKAMEQLKGMIEERGSQADMFSVTAMDPKELPAADLYVFSSPTEAFGIAGKMKSFLKKLDAPKGTKYALFNTHAMETPRALPKMEKLLFKKGMMLVAKANAQVGGSGENVNLKDGFDEQLEYLAEQIAPQ
jgi:flavodoxin